MKSSSHRRLMGCQLVWWATWHRDDWLIDSCHPIRIGMEVEVCRAQREECEDITFDVESWLTCLHIKPSFNHNNPNSFSFNSFSKTAFGIPIFALMSRIAVHSALMSPVWMGKPARQLRLSISRPQEQFSLDKSRLLWSRSSLNLPSPFFPVVLALIQQDTQHCRRSGSIRIQDVWCWVSCCWQSFKKVFLWIITWSFWDFAQCFLPFYLLLDLWHVLFFFALTNRFTNMTWSSVNVFDCLALRSSV